jgi:hypothetical protein
MATKFCHRLDRIGRLRNKDQIRLRADDRTQPFTKDRVILNAQDADRIGRNHRG